MTGAAGCRVQWHPPVARTGPGCTHPRLVPHAAAPADRPPEPTGAEASCRTCGDHVENPLTVLADGLQQASCSVAIAIVGLSAAGMGHVRAPPRLDAARTAS